MTSPRAQRHADTVREIVDAAWRLAAEHGLAGVTLRDVARAVGMQAPSLYSYFDSKAAIYDAMFVAGNRELMERQRAWAETEPLDLHGAARGFVDFCTENPTRYQLLFQRVVPGWQPSPDAYASALEVYAFMREKLAVLGIDSGRDLDLWTAVLTGLTDQQISNDPGGDRWTRLVDDAVDMLLTHIQGASR